MNIDNVIFIVTEDVAYGELIQHTLSKQKSMHVILFDNADMCTKSLHKKPSVIITDYYLNKVSGLQLIQKAKSFYKNCFTILISEDGAHSFSSFDDERFIKYVDKYIVKGMDDMEEMMNALSYS